MQYHEILTLKVCLYPRITWENPKFSQFRSISVGENIANSHTVCVAWIIWLYKSQACEEGSPKFVNNMVFIDKFFYLVTFTYLNSEGLLKCVYFIRWSLSGGRFWHRFDCKYQVWTCHKWLNSCQFLNRLLVSQIKL